MSLKYTEYQHLNLPAISKEILEKWEIERVDQVIDILGLWGDAVDGVDFAGVLDC